jgi:hypothetical protein
MRIRNQALDTRQVLEETDEWNRVELIEQGPLRRGENLGFEFGFQILLTPRVVKCRTRSARKFGQTQVENGFVQKIWQDYARERLRGIVSRAEQRIDREG